MNYSPNMWTYGKYVCHDLFLNNSKLLRVCSWLLYVIFSFIDPVPTHWPTLTQSNPEKKQAFPVSFMFCFHRWCWSLFENLFYICLKTWEKIFIAIIIRYSWYLEASSYSWFLFCSGEPKSVYVRNLPSDVTAEEVEQEFKNFGRIKPDGVFIRNRKVNLLVFSFC